MVIQKQISMTQSYVKFEDDSDDSSSNMTVENDDIELECSVVRTESRNNVDGYRVNARSLSLPAVVPDKTSISHISSVALQNSTDITFGNKTCYSGPVTVNQYGVEKPSKYGLGM